MSLIGERKSLALHTTLNVGGQARFFATCAREEEVKEALQFAASKSLSLAVLGGGSNTLVPDEGFNGLVLHVATGGISFSDSEESMIVTAGAGVSWDDLVRGASERDLWGIENLAGIPGSVGGAVVQNIGAYGAELSEVFVEAHALELPQGESVLVTPANAHFGYRTSIFKQTRDFIITTVRLKLSKMGTPRLSYPDLQKAKERGEPLSTSSEIAEAVRRIRAKKFPSEGSTAGSFFKNPVVSAQKAAELKATYPDMPQFESKNGVKLSLAWILDKVLHLTGYEKGNVRLFEAQPLVVVTRPGALASEVNQLADEVVQKVKDATGIAIEREVETLTAV